MDDERTKRIKEEIASNEIQAILVVDSETGEFVEAEIFHSGRMSPSKLANVVSRKIGLLELRYGSPKYEVLDEVYGSLESFYSEYPQLSHLKPR